MKIIAIKRLNDYNETIIMERRALVVSELDSRLEGRGFECHPILGGNGIKAMPGLIPAPNPGSFN